MPRQFTIQDVEEVQQFAAERMAILEALHPRKRHETPDHYIDRLAKLPAPEDEMLVARAFIEGMAAALALDVDQLFAVGPVDDTSGRPRHHRTRDR